jgi:hypothetical protein
MKGMETGLISQGKNFILWIELEIKSQCSSAVEQRFRNSEEGFSFNFTSLDSMGFEAVNKG